MARARARWVCDARASRLARARRESRARGAHGDVSPTPTRRALEKNATQTRARDETPTTSARTPTTTSREAR